VAEEKAVREWLAPFSKFVKGEDVPWGTSEISQFRRLMPDARVVVVQDPHWQILMDTAAVLKRVIAME